MHRNVTAHPTAEWTLQQFREALPGDHTYRFAIHDRDRIRSKDPDQAVEAMGVRVLRTPVRAPKGNSYCERIVRTARRACLDFMIPFSAGHLRHTLVEWAAHYNHGRPHRSLGPGIPLPLDPLPSPPHVAIRFAAIVASGRSPSWEVFTTSIFSKSWQHDGRPEYLRTSLRASGKSFVFRKVMEPPAGLEPATC